MDVDRSIRVAVDTGDVTLGSEKSIQSLKLGKGQLVIVAANTPKDIVEDVEYYRYPIIHLRRFKCRIGFCLW